MMSTRSSCASVCPLPQLVPIPGLAKNALQNDVLNNLSEKGSSYLRKGRLRVKAGVAGLELDDCERGFLVEEVDDYPGQPDLRQKDIIVAIGSTTLIGLQQEEIEDLFEAEFRDEAPIVCGAEADLAKLTLEQIKKAIAAFTSHKQVQIANPQQFNNNMQACDEVCCSNLKEQLENGCLALDDSDNGVQVCDNGCRAICHSTDDKSWLGVRGRPGVLRGLYQFEVEVVGSSLLRVGVGTQAARRKIGMDGRSFGYGGTGMKSTAGKFEEYGEKFEAAPGAVVACLLDRRDPERQNISFCLNGQHQGVAFTIPANMADLPLFPMVCGRGRWQALCSFRNLTYPWLDFGPWSEALQAGDAVARTDRDELPEGLTSKQASATVRRGHRVSLHVSDGAWDGWHACEVLDVDGLGCYLRHEEDGFTETIPWSFLNARYRMRLLSECEHSSLSSTLDVMRSVCGVLQRTLFKLADVLPEDVTAFIDTFFTTKQQSLIIWLASPGVHKDRFVWRDSDAQLSSSDLQEWLKALELSAHSKAIDSWCKQEGIVSLMELIENRDALASALCGRLSPSELLQLQSILAEEKAEVVYFRCLKGELVALLDTIVQSLDGAHLQSIRRQSSFSNEEWIFIEAASSTCNGMAKVSHQMTNNQQTASAICATSRVMTSTAARISKRDEKLLQLAASTSTVAQSHIQQQQCEGCGSYAFIPSDVLPVASRQGESGDFSDDGCFYCKACWKSWLDEFDSECKLNNFNCERTSSFGMSKGGA